VHESIVHTSFRPARIAHTFAILLHDSWTIYDPHFDFPFVCHTYTILVKQSTGHTHTGHTDRENTPDTGTHAHDKTPNEHLPQALNNAQRWRDDVVVNNNIV